ncbi:MAG TPA: NAD(P)-dependent oxidoreductase [Bacteroidota bacterium]|nr:NAD(P)-dependent oxidoreductase [Bacteroidota bacterium]
MNILVYSAAGNIGTRILQEALTRGHKVTAAVRHPEKITLKHPNLTVQRGDILDERSIAALSKGHDAVISAYGPAHDDPNGPATYTKAAQALINGLKKAGVKRLVTIGGAGSLYVAPGTQLVDTPEFPSAWRPGALGLRDALEVFKKEKELEWTFFSPAVMIEPGKRTGKYRLGKDEPVYDSKGESKISTEDYAAAMLDEVEKPRHIRQRFTVGY